MLESGLDPAIFLSKPRYLESSLPTFSPFFFLKSSFQKKLLGTSKLLFNIKSFGLKPNAKWSFNATKKYYGVKGDKDKAYASMQQLVKDYKEFKSKHLTYETN